LLKRSTEELIRSSSLAIRLSSAEVILPKFSDCAQPAGAAVQEAKAAQRRRAAAKERSDAGESGSFIDAPPPAGECSGSEENFRPFE
jgi:hypothetical protein